MVQKILVALLGIAILNFFVHWMFAIESQASMDILLATVIAAVIEPWVTDQVEG